MKLTKEKTSLMEDVEWMSFFSLLLSCLVCFLHVRDQVYVLLDPLVQISIDESRNVLYTRSEKGSIQVGHDNILTALATDILSTVIFQVKRSSWLSLLFAFY